MKTLTTLILLSLNACYGPDTSHGITFVMDSSKLSDAQKASFNDGISKLNTALGCPAVVVASGTCASGQNCIKVEAIHTGKEVGQCDYGNENDTLLIDPALNPDALRVTALHEIGHAFNLYFSDNPKDTPHSKGAGIMFAYIEQYATDADLFAAIEVEASEIKATGFTCAQTGGTLTY